MQRNWLIDELIITKWRRNTAREKVVFWNIPWFGKLDFTSIDIVLVKRKSGNKSIFEVVTFAKLWILINFSSPSLSITASQPIDQQVGQSTAENR